LIVLDVDDEKTITAAVKQVSEKTKKIDVLINNAAECPTYPDNVLDLKKVPSAPLHTPCTVSVAPLSTLTSRRLV